MRAHTRHPGTDELADFQAGLTSGPRGKRLAAHVAQCQACASVSDRIDAISTELAAMPPLTIPRQVERRITAALMAEASARDIAAATDGTAATDAAARQAERAVAEHGRHWHEHLWSLRVPVFSRTLTVPLGAFVPAVVVLLLAVAGYALTLSAAPPSHPAAAASGPAGRGAAAFVVVVSGTDFQAATLGTQVRQELAAGPSGAGSAPVRSRSGAQSIVPREGRPSAGTSGRDVTPSGSLVGCVMRVTGHREPAMVDRASYESRPVYVIAVADRAWVVPLNCTADHPSVIRSVDLSPAA